MQTPPTVDSRLEEISAEHRQWLLDARAVVHEIVVRRLGEAHRTGQSRSDGGHVLAATVEAISQLMSERKIPMLSGRLRDRLAHEVVDEIVGFGPLQALLDDATVTEILVNGPAEIFAERSGRFSRATVAFDDGEHIVRTMQRILSPLGRRLDERSPMVDARLSDGSRVNAVIPPVAVGAPVVTIRKHAEDPFALRDLVEFGTLSASMYRFLEAAVQARLNVVVSGGPGSGKTTLLRALTRVIPDGQRVIVMEDSAELMIQRENFVSLEARPPTAEGAGGVSIGDLVRNALRMRPDRIIVGEVRGAEALDMLQALNTGTEGSLSTLHSNSPQDALVRLESMCMMGAADLSPRAIARQIDSAIHLIVQTSRFSDGTRKITHIAELIPQPGELAQPQETFTFRQTGTDADGTVLGEHEYVAESLRCAPRLQRLGIDPERLLKPAGLSD